VTTTYRYLFADLLTNTILAELPLTGVSFTTQLNQAGTFSGHLLLGGIDATEYNAYDATVPARTALYVDRNGTLLWGGVIWGRSYDSRSQTLSIEAREFESYFERRRITQTTAFTNIDQLAIARNLITQAQSALYGNIGVLVGTETSGVTISRTYYDYEYKGVYSAFQDLSRGDNGFDFNIDVAYDGSGNPTKTLALGYPRLGTAYSTTSTTVPVFVFPAGNIVEYNYPEDGSIAANTIYALGAGSNEGKLIVTGQDTTKFTDGWALLEEQANYSDVTDQTYLQDLADGQIAAVSYPPTILKISVPAFIDPIVGTYFIGDDARVMITDNWTAINDDIFRIVGITVQPGEAELEKVTLTLTTGT